MPLFRVIDSDGNDLGPFQSSTQSWKAGDVIPLRPGEQLEVVNIVQAEPWDDVYAYLVVRPKEPAAPHGD